MYIKNLKPQKNGRFKQGYINPASCKKLFEGLERQPIIYRSSWEKRFIQWCEVCPSIVHWGSECVSISYYLPLDEKNHTYYPDFVIEKDDGTRMVIEIKPHNQVEKPDADNSWAMQNYIRNMSKWRAIKEACEQRGYKFCILTEKTINRL